MKIRILAVLLALLLLSGAMCACGNAKKDGEPEQTRPESSSEETPVRPDGSDKEDTADYRKLAAVPFEGLNESPADDFSVEERADGVTVTGYTGSESRVRIPAAFNGKPVTALADGAFKDRNTLTVLMIPDSVTVFGRDLLVGCSSLYALRTPLPTQEGCAFLGYLYGAEIYEKNNMSDLRELDFLEIGGTLTELPAYALYDCNDLVCVTLPQSMTSLATYSLYRCESLKYLNAEHLERVADHAMDFCASLQSLVFGDGLREIGLGAFENCVSLRRLTVPFIGGSRTGNTWLGYVFGAAVPEFSKGFYPSGLREITILDGCDKVGNYAFYECTPVQRINLPASIEHIGIRAFSGCVRLESIALPDSVCTIGELAFSGCTALASVQFGTGLTGMGMGAFSGCTALTGISLPESLTYLPDSCFSGCTALQDVTLGGVATIGKNAFYHCAFQVGS